MTSIDLENARVLLAVESLAATRGGIAKVARLTDRVLSELLPPDRIRRVTFTDSKSPADYCARGSKAKFLAAVWKHAAWSTHIIYDFLGMARTHPWIPGLKRPGLSWIHGVEVWPPIRPERLRAAKRMTEFVCNSSFTRDRAKASFAGIGRGQVCWLATEEETTPSQSQSPRPSVLILGRPDHDLYKGHRELIACWPRVLKAVPEATLTIAGDGPAIGTVRKLAEGLANVSFTGLVGADQLADLWKQTAVFAMPSRGEGFGLVYVEAMRQGIPVVASVHDAASEINVDGVTGYNVNLDNPDELPGRLVELLRSPATARSMGRAGQARWEANFCFGAFRERFSKILREFLSR